MRRHYRLFILLFMAVLSAVGPLVADMYLPALPQLPAFFGCEVPQVQLSLSLCLWGLAIGQFIIGPLTDKYGRRKPLIICLFIFLAATLATIVSDNITCFLVARFVQGFSGSVGLIASKVVLADKFHGIHLTRALSFIMAVGLLAPMVAPVIGSGILAFAPWQAIFAAVALVIVGMIVASFNMQETLPPRKRRKLSIAQSFALFVPVLANKRFTCFSLVLGFAFGVNFSFIAASPHIFETHFGLSEQMYSLFFALNSIGMVISTLLLPRFRRVEHALILGTAGGVVLAVAHGFTVMTDMGFWPYEITMFALLFLSNWGVQGGINLAMRSEQRYAGTASAFVGGFMFLLAGIVSPIVGIGEPIRTAALAFLVLSLLSGVFAAVALRMPRQKKEKEEGAEGDSALPERG